MENFAPPNEGTAGSGLVMKPWPEMIPLEVEAPSAKQFPVDSLGDILEKGARAIHKLVKSPESMCAQAVLAAANVACAGHHDIEIDGRKCPNTNYFFTTAPSGERKTGTDKLALYPHRQHEENLRAAYNIETKKYEEEKSAYAADRKRLQGKKDKSELEQLTKPGEPPSPPLLTIGDTTIEGLQNLFAGGLSRIGIFTTEAGNIFGGGWSMQDMQRIRTAACFSSLWDGHIDPRARGMTGFASLARRRTTAHFGCQPLIAAKVLGATDLEGQGWLARILPAWPTSAIGTRSYESANPIDNVDYRNYCNAIDSLLKKILPISPDHPGELNPPTLRLSPSAKAIWIKFHDAIERDAKVGGKLFVIQPFACKAAEHVLRLAGVLTGVASEKEISISTVNDSIELVLWYAEEWMRIKSICRAEVSATNASKLLEWLKSKRLSFFTTTDVYQKGPTEFRSVKAAKDVIEELEARNIIRGASSIETAEKPTALRCAAMLDDLRTELADFSKTLAGRDAEPVSDLGTI